MVKQYFDDLHGLGLFNNTNADRIALLYIYFPLIRNEIYKFVDLWNSHKIRFQKNRPALPTGKPIVLYNTPDKGIRDYAFNPNRDVLQELQKEVECWGMLNLQALSYCSLELILL